MKWSTLPSVIGAKEKEEDKFVFSHNDHLNKIILFIEFIEY